MSQGFIHIVVYDDELLCAYFDEKEALRHVRDLVGRKTYFDGLNQKSWRTPDYSSKLVQIESIDIFDKFSMPDTTTD